MRLACGISIGNFILMAQSLSLASIKAGITEGSVSVASTQKAPGGFTVYRVVFKVRINILDNF